MVTTTQKIDNTPSDGIPVAEFLRALIEKGKQAKNQNAVIRELRN